MGKLDNYCNKHLEKRLQTRIIKCFLPSSEPFFEHMLGIKPATLKRRALPSLTISSWFIWRWLHINGSKTSMNFVRGLPDERLVGNIWLIPCVKWFQLVRNFFPDETFYMDMNWDLRSAEMVTSSNRGTQCDMMPVMRCSTQQRRAEFIVCGLW